MPELPEVETIVRTLAQELPGKKIESVSFDWEKSYPDHRQSKALVEGQSILEVRRRAKMIFIVLSSGVALHIHLKMTGQLVLKDPMQETFPFPNKTTRIIFELSDGWSLFFNDVRKFGWVRILPLAELTESSTFAHLGPEPLSRQFTTKGFTQALKKHPKTNIKALLLSQKAVVGLGNIYTDEALFLAGILPDRPVSGLQPEEIKKLFRAIRRVLRTSLDMGGSTRRDYRNARGELGHYLDQAFVYGRTGEPCRRCQTPIRKIRVAARGTHFCPHCQK